ALANRDLQEGARHKILNSAAGERFWVSIRQAQGVEILSAPKIVVWDRQSAQVDLGQERAFVTGFQAKGDTQLEPKTLTVREGLRFTLQPAVQVDGHIELASTVRVSSINEIRKNTVVVAGRSETVEIPDVSVVQVQSTVKVLPADLLLVVIPASAQGTTRVIALETTPHRSTPVAAKRPAAQSTPQSEPEQETALTVADDRRRLSLDFSGWSMSVDAGPAGDRPATLDFQSKAGMTRYHGTGSVSFRLAPSLSKPGTPASLTGQAADFVLSRSGTVDEKGGTNTDHQLRLTLKGRVVLKSAEFDISCQQADLEMALPSRKESDPALSGLPRTQMRLTGDVRLTGQASGKSRQRTSIQAEQITLLVSGNSLLSLNVDSAVPAAVSAETAAAPVKTAARPAQPDAEPRLVVKNYPVADLGAPLPGLLSLAAPGGAETAAPADFRVFRGEGLRLRIPALGPTPVALDLAYPLKADSQSPEAGAKSVQPTAIASVHVGLIAPAAASVPAQADAAAKTDEKPKIDLQPLQDFIQSRIAPASWQAQGGPGVISIYEAKHSLVIRQTPEIHEQIASLLRSLRRELDVQVSLELKLVQLEDRQWWKRFGFVEKPKQLSEGLPLSESQVERFRSLKEVVNPSLTTQFPKVTVFNQQVVEMTLPAVRDSTRKPLTLAMSPTVDDDRRGLRLNLACNVTNREEALSAARSVRLRADECLLLDLGTDVVVTTESQRGVPMLSKVPYMNRLFKNVTAAPQAGAAGPAVLVLVTPRIIILEEEEESLKLPQEKQ
ncbi:MAG: hypothetical protein JSS02_26620, partial [Planctomycetes bacterium]|nr:hypothetical protein [Planctomycetota bacterium]